MRSFFTMSVGLLVLAVGVVSPQEITLLDTWAETLKFGIDSEVSTAIDQIKQSGERSLDEAIATRFDQTHSNDLKVTIVQYFTDLESPQIATSVRTLLTSEEPLPDDLLRVCAAYMSRIVKDDGDDLVERYAAIAKDSNVLAASVAIDAIGRNGGTKAISTLLDLYGTLDATDLRAAVLRALGDTGSTDALPLLTSVAEDDFQESALREYATESLGKIHAPESMTLLTNLLTSNDSVLRAYATGAIGNYTGDDAGQLLEDALLDEFWRVRVAAIQGLAASGRTSAIPAIEYKARRDPERPVRQAAMKALGNLGGAEARGVLEELAKNTRLSDADRVIALQQLGARDAAASASTFTEIIDSEWSRDSSTLLDTIGRQLSEHPDPAFASTYVRFLSSPNFVVRIYGMRGISGAGLTDQIPTLEKIASDNPAGLIRRSAIAALKQMGIDYDPEAQSDGTEPAGPDTPESK